MKKSEILKDIENYDRKAKKYDKVITRALYVYVFFAVLGSVALLFSMHFYEVPWWVLLGVTGSAVVAMIVVTEFQESLNERLFKKKGIMCPKCFKNLHKEDAKVAIATGRCPFCRQEVIEE